LHFRCSVEATTGLTQIINKMAITKKNKGGVPSKYKDGIKTKKIHPTIPVSKEKECLDAIDKIVENDKR
jgi:hypothetical protein